MREVQIRHLPDLCLSTVFFMVKPCPANPLQYDSGSLALLLRRTCSRRT